MVKKYIIGVDGGGTKTEAVAYDLDGNVLTTGYSDHGNLLIDWEKAISHIMDAIRQCLTKLKTNRCVYIYLGLAGIDSGAHRDDLEKELQQFAIPFSISNDARIAHAALLKGKDGILTISGTGAVSYGVCAGLLEMGGGWGHLLGDEGSGYWIVMESFKKMVLDYDNARAISTLSARLLQELGLRIVPDIKRFVYTKTKGEIAAVVPFIVSMADSGDRVAQNVLEEAGKCLAEMTLSLYEKLQFDGEVLIAMKGSVLTCIDRVKNGFISRISSRVEHVRFVDEEVSATIGAYYLALQEMNESCILGKKWEV